MKRLIALLLAVFLLPALAACGNTELSSAALEEKVTRAAEEAAHTPEPTPEPETFAQRLARSQEQMKDINSMRMEMDMNIGIGLFIGEQAQDMEIELSYGMDVQQKPLKISGSMDMTVSGQRQSALLYGEGNGDAMDLYASTDNGASWTKSNYGSLEESGVPVQDTEEQLNAILPSADTFTETGKQTFNGAEATVYQGVITGDYVGETVKSSGMLDMLSTSFNGQITEDMFTDLGNIAATVAIDDASGYVVFYEMDMKDTMQALMSKMLAAAFEAYGLDEGNVRYEISQYVITISMSKFDSVGEIEKPEGVVAAAESKETDAEQEARVYKLTGLMEDGEDMSETLAALDQMNMSILLVLRNDGTGYMESNGNQLELTWDENTITSEGESVPYTIEGDTLVMSTDTVVMTYTLQE